MCISCALETLLVCAGSCLCMQAFRLHMQVHACVCRPRVSFGHNFQKIDVKPRKSDCLVSATSNVHNLLNISPDYAKFVFKLKHKMSNFQWNKSHSKSFCGSKGMVKTVSKCHFLVLISKRFEHFWVVITSKLSWTL